MSNDEIYIIIAAACHEANRVYCESLGDMSQVGWSDAPNWQKASVINGVKQAIADPSPGASHQRWVEYKESQGWTWGLEKDAKLKTHPNMVPFHELDSEQKQKDIIFVRTALEMAGVLWV